MKLKNLKYVLLAKVSLLLGCSTEPKIEDLFKLAKENNHVVCFTVFEPIELEGKYCIYEQKQ